MVNEVCRCDEPRSASHAFWTGTAYRAGQRCTNCGLEVVAPAAPEPVAEPEPAAVEETPAEQPAEQPAEAPADPAPTRRRRNAE